MVIPVTYKGKEAFHMMYGEDTAPGMVRYSFFSTIPLSVLYHEAPQIMHRMFSPSLKTQSYLKALAQELIDIVLDSPSCHQLFYPDFLLQNGALPEFTLNSIIEYMQADTISIGRNIFSSKTNSIRFHVYANDFRAMCIDGSIETNESLIETGSQCFEESIETFSAQHYYTDLWKIDNLFYCYSEETMRIRILTSYSHEPLLFLTERE